VASELDFRHVSAADGDGAALLAAMIDEMRELYSGLDLNSPDMPVAGMAELAPPAGTFLVGYRDGQAVCAGGIKRLPDGACEIKRMYVVPAARKQGVARSLLRALEDAARGLGYRIVRLDTGPLQPHARGLYESEGYVPIANFNGNPVATFFGEKHLAG
jgi:GNAT superfamily N-acetyltransferase